MKNCRNRGKVRFAKRLTGLGLLAWFGIALPAWPQDQTISQMVHTAWTGKDGAPQAVSVFARTPDGTLWIGSEGGLYTFDGEKFEAFRARPGSPSLSTRTIQFLLVSKAGDLWVFGFHGAPVRIVHGDTQLYDRTESEPIENLANAQQDSSGAIWAVLNYKHVVRLGSDGVWHRAEDPVEGTGYIRKLFIDSSDTQWVVENDRLFRRPAQRVNFTPTGVYVYGSVKIAESPDHTLWMAGQGPKVSGGPPRASGLQHIDPTGSRLPAPRISGEIDDVLIAGDGSLWMSKTHEGLERLSPQQLSNPRADLAEPADLYRVSDGLSSGGQHTLLRDEDGNVWVGGTSGLDRFEQSTLVPIVAGAKAGAWFSCVDPQSRVWVGDQNGRVGVVKDGRIVEVYGAPSDLANLVCGEEGRVYVLDLTGITVIENGRMRRLPRLPKSAVSSEHYMFLDVLELPDGDLLAAPGDGTEHGLWIFKEGKWSRYLPGLALPEVGAMLRDSDGVLYLAFTNSDDVIGRVKAGSLETASAPVQPTGFAQTSYGTFVYGTHGVGLDRGKSFQQLLFLDPEQTKMITGAAQSHDGDLWVNGIRGIVRIPAAEIRDAISDPSHRLRSINFQEGDFVGPDIYLEGRNSAHADAGGRLWFSMLNGIVSVDPEHLPAQRHPPQLVIRSIQGDGRSLNANATFPPNTQYIDVKYFGLDLTRARDVIYRYRLDGLDTTWQDVASRTEAIYTHLRPGRYRFEVMASSGNGVWTTPVSSVPFTILPRFYELRWFQALTLFVVAVLLWFGLSLRVRNVSREIKVRAEERADERIRIARELHDTLLQGVQGLLLSFHVAAQKVPPDHESKRALERALTTADRIIVEGRNRVNRLRSERLTDSELKSLIEGVAADLTSNEAIQFSVKRAGSERTLQGHVVDEIFCITREALTNAFRYAAASKIEVELNYDKREFRMICRDNGRGFDLEAFHTNGMNGHWGLRGMEERAEKIGAKFSCDSSVGKGTDVRVIVPARNAYVRRHGFFL